MQISSSKSINQNMHENGVGLTQLPSRSHFLKLFFIVNDISPSILFILILTLKFASWWICLSAPIFPMTVESKEARPLRPATAYRETCPIPSTPLWSSQQLCPKCLQTSQTVLYNTTPSPPPIIPSLANSDASLPIGKRGSPSTLHPAPPTNSTFPTILSSPYLHPQYLSPLPAPMPVFQPIFNLAAWMITTKTCFTPSMIFYPYHSSPYKRKHNSGYIHYIYRSIGKVGESNKCNTKNLAPRQPTTSQDPQPSQPHELRS